MFRATHPSATLSSFSSSSSLSSSYLLWCGSLWVQPLKTSVKLLCGKVVTIWKFFKNAKLQHLLSCLRKDDTYVVFSHFEVASSSWAKRDQGGELEEKQVWKLVKPPIFYTRNYPACKPASEKTTHLHHKTCKLVTKVVRKEPTHQKRHCWKMNLDCRVFWILPLLFVKWHYCFRIKYE